MIEKSLLENDWNILDFRFFIDLYSRLEFHYNKGNNSGIPSYKQSFFNLSVYKNYSYDSFILKAIYLVKTYHYYL